MQVEIYLPCYTSDYLQLMHLTHQNTHLHIQSHIVLISPSQVKSSPYFILLWR